MDRLLTVNQGKNGQKHKKSSTDVVLWKIQFCEKCIKSLIIVWRKSLVNWNEVSRGFCACFLPTSPRKKCSKQLERIRTRHFKRSNIPFHYPLGNIIWHGAGLLGWCGDTSSLWTHHPWQGWLSSPGLAEPSVLSLPRLFPHLYNIPRGPKRLAWDHWVRVWLYLPKI